MTWKTVKLWCKENNLRRHFIFIINCFKICMEIAIKVKRLPILFW